LIGFWFHRLSATKSAVKAMLVNRVSDTFLLISIVLMWWYLGSTDYGILFANTTQAYYTDWICLTLLLGAAGKSAQIGLHVWLVDAMEGNGILWFVFFSVFLFFLNYFFFLRSTENAFIATQEQQEMDSSYLMMSQLPCFYPKVHGHAIIGDLLGDGHITLSKNGSKGRFELTQSCKTVGGPDFIHHLRYSVYKDLCNSTSNLTLWPKSFPTQYWFGTKYYSWMTEIHKEWYIPNIGLATPHKLKYVKVLPPNIESYLSPLVLAHWIMGDGYWATSENVVILCTDSFTKTEVEMLILSLFNKFGLKSHLKERIRTSGKVCYRLRFRRKDKNIELLQSIVSPYILPTSRYKIGF